MYCQFVIIGKSLFIISIPLQKLLERNIVTMSYKEGEINELQQKIESQKEVSIDDAVVAPAPLYNQ